MLMQQYPQLYDRKTIIPVNRNSLINKALGVIRSDKSKLPELYWIGLKRTWHSFVSF